MSAPATGAEAGTFGSQDSICDLETELSVREMLSRQSAVNLFDQPDEQDEQIFFRIAI